ncbi:MAG: alpha/beta fold hydrolase [Verrucomicrobiota bacterium]
MAEVQLHRLDVEAAGDEVRGGVMLAHGLGEHIERYRSIAEGLAAEGHVVTGVDFEGHGRSPGIRGHLGNWEAVERVFDEQVARLREATGEGKPLGMVAHSMGAFLGLRYLELKPEVFSFAWLSSPLLRPREMKSGTVRLGGRMLAAMWPRLRLDSGVRPQLCRVIPEDEEADPYFHAWVTVGWGVELWNLEKEIYEELGRVNPGLRVLVTQGSEDPICPTRHARALYESLGVEDKEWRLYDGELHEPLFGDRAGEVLGDVREWMIRGGGNTHVPISK